MVRCLGAMGLVGMGGGLGFIGGFWFRSSEDISKEKGQASDLGELRLAFQGLATRVARDY